MAHNPRGELAGKRLGTYELTELLGAGGMAEVYLARDLNLGRKVAVKILPRELAADPGYVKRFQDEAKRVANLQHPHIIPIYYAGDQDGLLYMVMPVVPESLRGRIEHKGLPTPEQAIEWCVQVAEALSAAHQIGLIHRDVKPENILINADGNALLTDFGIAREVHRPSRDGKRTMQTMSASGLPVGTPEYMAPEQFLGGSVGPQADIYALGVVLYELLTGRTPRQASSPMEIAAQTLSRRPVTPPAERNARVWPALNRAVMTALEHEPQDRFDEMGRFHYALKQSLNYRDESARPPRPRTSQLDYPAPPNSNYPNYTQRPAPRSRPLDDVDARPRLTTRPINHSRPTGYPGPNSRPLEGGRAAPPTRPINHSRPLDDSYMARPANGSRPLGTQGPMPGGSASTVPEGMGFGASRFWAVRHHDERRDSAWRRFWWLGLVALLLLGIAGVSLGGVLTGNQAALTWSSGGGSGNGGTGATNTADGGKSSPTGGSNGGALLATQDAATATSISATATVFNATATAQGTVLPTPTATDVPTATATNTPVPPTPTPAPLSFNPPGPGNVSLTQWGAAKSPTYPHNTCSGSITITNNTGSTRSWSWSSGPPQQNTSWVYVVKPNGSSTGDQTFTNGIWPSDTIPSGQYDILVVTYVMPANYSSASCQNDIYSYEVQLRDSAGVPYSPFYIQSAW